MKIPGPRKWDAGLSLRRKKTLKMKGFKKRDSEEDCIFKPAVLMHFHFAADTGRRQSILPQELAGISGQKQGAIPQGVSGVSGRVRKRPFKLRNCSLTLTEFKR
jgi:hypothetical protein